MKIINIFKPLWLVLAIFVLAACAPTTGTEQAAPEQPEATSSGSIMVASSPAHDWGDINIQGGNVSHVFELKNDGTSPLYLNGAQTSCMCTTAVYTLADGSISPQYGMHNNSGLWTGEVAPGESFMVNVVFDPMAHGPDAVGPIQRSIRLMTSAQNAPVLELTAGGNVLYEEEFNEKNES
ncbi:MAG: DUF1573 domain-containing protein [Candidatus Peregrinibacteria bacterium]|nr:DUF1573 domain-containing protein [Candidatus Peregrinibacteria bacterium]